MKKGGSLKFNSMKKIITLVVIILVALNAKAQSLGKYLEDKIGMVSYTYRKSFQKDVGATLDTIKFMGVTNMEFSNLFGKTAADLKKLLDERGMRCTSFGVGYEDLMNKTDEVGKNAKTLGASFVRVAWIPHDNAAGFTIDNAKKTVADFNKVGKLLKEKYGLTFCYHNHGYEFVTYNNGTLYDYIVDNTKPKYVSFELDILWAQFPGMDPAELLKKHGKRIKLMHVKDLKKGIKGDFSGKTDVNNDVALGEGQIHIPAVMRAAKKAGLAYYYIEDESDFVKKQVPQSLTFLKEL
jgi:sugar phosphate isomerase/epimerase